MRELDLHTDRPHPARVYDYLLGGKDNFAADREAAHQGIRANPDSRIPPRENRLFLRRAVRFLAEPGLQVVPAWRPDLGEHAAEPQPSDAQVSVYGAAARKP
ncbi:hypothetical protein HH310_01285 [Actinoplanes sp. TBRC 11911]|uniref:SAM-dependent methyltransferase n=1 Tax=Actinoplanes sp. TBRC 11911 TaxID=2729386 RepID=UPI00145E96F7|nr:SAM-dependent methyltransferase [Actinoplanes sp. TBRC 11911]NMO49834.1 hypothetical protein [Actinoplanes sp. TBRC 11911]